MGLFQRQHFLRLRWPGPSISRPICSSAFIFPGAFFTGLRFLKCNHTLFSGIHIYQLRDLQFRGRRMRRRHKLLCFILTYPFHSLSLSYHFLPRRTRKVFFSPYHFYFAVSFLSWGSGHWTCCQHEHPVPRGGASRHPPRGTPAQGHTSFGPQPPAECRFGASKSFSFFVI